MTLVVLSSFAFEPNRVDSILERDAIARGDAAYLSVVSAGLMDSGRSPEEALRLVLDLADGTRFQHRTGDPDHNEPVTLGEFSFMLMLAHDIPGGVWYRLFPGPRYSFRELRARRIILEPGLQNQAVDGDRSFRIVTRLGAQGGD